MSDEVKEGIVVTDEDEQPDELPYSEPTATDTAATEWLVVTQDDAEKVVEKGLKS